MPQKSKLEKEYQIEEDGTTVVPKEILPQIAPTVLKNTVKRERTEAQKANFEKVVQANKERWAKIRAEKEASTAQAKQAVKEDHQAKVEAGTHVRVAVKEKRVQKPREKGSQNESRPLGKVVVEEPEESSEEEEVIVVKKPQSSPASLVKEKVVKPRKVSHPKWIAVHSDTDTPTETEDDTDMEEYKSGKRQIRREVKKNIRAIEKIDQVVQQTMVNPYSALLASRWK